MTKLVIFTDLDGTLLDYNYSFEPARPALRLLDDSNVPLVICSSKTRREIEHFRGLLNNRHPFVVENGGGILVPRDYFSFELTAPGSPMSLENDYVVIRLGVSYALLRAAMDRLKGHGFRVRGFGDMTTEDVAALTGLTIEEACRAKTREFDEPFVFQGKEEDLPPLLSAIESMGLAHTRGQFFHLMGGLIGGSDKGMAVSILAETYRRQFGSIITVALGDSENDLPMLQRADLAVIIRKPDGQHITHPFLPNPLVTDEPGPAGWNKVVAEIVKRYVGS